MKDDSATRALYLIAAALAVAMLAQASAPVPWIRAAAVVGAAGAFLWPVLRFKGWLWKIPAAAIAAGLVEWGIERLPIGGRIDSVLVSDSFTVTVLIAGNAWLVWRWRRV
jgi:hypothetical protein